MITLSSFVTVHVSSPWKKAHYFNSRQNFYGGGGNYATTHLTYSSGQKWCPA